MIAFHRGVRRIFSRDWVIANVENRTALVMKNSIVLSFDQGLQIWLKWII